MTEGHASSPPDAFRLYPPPSFPLDSSEIYADLILPRASSVDRPYTIINAVSTLDGKAALEGKSSTIGSAVDRTTMRNIRCAVDAVVVGAGTLRAENIDLSVPKELSQKRRANQLRDQPLPIILKGYSRLPEGRKVYEQEDMLIVGPQDVRADYIPDNVSFLAVRSEPVTGVDVGEVLRVLKEEFGVERLLVEGGPAVNHSFLAGGHADELFLTLAPRISVGGDAPTIVSGPGTLPKSLNNAKLVSVHATADGELYLRYRL